MEGRPFVNYSMLGNYVGKIVSVFGKVKNISPNGNQLTMHMLDGNEVSVALKDSLDEMLQGVILVTARVEPNKSLLAEHLISFGGENIDSNMITDAVKLTSRYPELFSYREEIEMSY